MSGDAGQLIIEKAKLFLKEADKAIVALRQNVSLDYFLNEFW